ncbi:hypothetical protein [Micromonospora gifhornensis]|uniref:hypothetical protein n=1 Tax=Micromonospora gifhornensis TaxID=84594 RepID=UPI00195448FD|nr:hypothetical protein [Micromonospora gifhornensis]
MSVGVSTSVAGIESKRGVAMKDGWALEQVDRWVRRGWGRFLLLVVALTVAGTVVAVLPVVVLAESNVLINDSRFWRGDGPDWAGSVGLLLCLPGLAWMGGCLWWLVRNGYYERHARTRRRARNWSHRRHLIRQVRGTAVRRDEDRPLLPLVAEDLIDQPKFLVPLYGLTLLQVGQVFRQWAPGFVLIAVLFVGVIAVVTVQSRRDARSAKVFLAEHANSETPHADG